VNLSELSVHFAEVNVSTKGRLLKLNYTHEPEVEIPWFGSWIWCSGVLCGFFRTLPCTCLVFSGSVHLNACTVAAEGATNAFSQLHPT
jgi:hypothetical protein